MNLKLVAQWIVQKIILNATTLSVFINHLCVTEKMIVVMQVMNRLNMLVVHLMWFASPDSGLAQVFQMFVSMKEKFVTTNQIVLMVRTKVPSVTMLIVTIIGDNVLMVVYKHLLELFVRVPVEKF